MAKLAGEKAQYIKLYETIKKEIENGRYKPGDILPSESEMRGANGVTQPVVRQALALLVNEHYIKKHQGKGSIVLTRPLGVGLFSLEGENFTSQDDDCAIETDIVEGPVVVEDMPISQFGEDSNSSWYKISRTRAINGEKVFYEELYLPNRDLPRFASRQLDNISFYKTLNKSYQISISACEQKFWAVMVPENLSDLLQVPKNTPVQELLRKFETNRPGFYIYSKLYANTEKFHLYSKI